MPRWTVPPHDASPAASRAPRVGLSAATDVLSLRPHLTQSVSRVDVTVTQPLAGPVRLRLSASSGSARTAALNRVLFDSPRSEAVAAGVEFAADVPVLGSLFVAAMPGWDRGPGGRTGVAARGPRHAVALSGWRTNGRHSRVFLGGDDARHVGEAHRAQGVRAEIVLALTLGPAELRPGAVWQNERLETESSWSDAYLAASPAGSTSTVEWTLGGGFGPVGWVLAWGGSSMDLASAVSRSGQSAGRLSYAHLTLDRWRAAGSLRGGGRAWGVSLGREHATGELSARVETWPFAGFWESVAAQAYRLNAGLRGESTTVAASVGPITGPGWTWGAQAARYVVATERDSWLVTGFGFGRRDRELRRAGADPAYFVGAHVRRTLAVRAGSFTLGATASVPVHYRSIGAHASAQRRGVSGVPGHASLAVAWSR